MATKKRAKKTARKTTRKAGSIFKIASRDKSYVAAKKRAAIAVKKSSAAYKAAIKKAKSKRK
jgi:hypothetical protein